MPVMGKFHVQPTVAAIAALSILLSISSIQCIGVNYGTIANNLPPPQTVAQFLSQSTTITHVKLFDSDPAILHAFAHSPIAVTVSVPNHLIPILTNLTSAHNWVRQNLLPHALTTNIVRVLLGNEVLSTSNKSLISSLVPSMQNLHIALSASSLAHRVQVSTPHSLGTLSTSDPPSTGRFREGYDEAVLKPLLSFLRATGAPFMVNAYPFFGFTEDTLDFALFRPNYGARDRFTGLAYENMLDAQLDAVYSALGGLGFGDVEIVISETGWPSVGEPWQVGVDVDNAAEYNRNLIRHVTSGVGTPLMPNRTFETYVFALFNEDLKPGPVSERNFGLFRADLTPVYDVGLLRTSQNETPRMSEPLNPTKEMQWCEARADVGLDALQANIDYVCGLGLNCLPIQDGGECFFPNNVRAHAGYAMNEYYRSNGRNPFDCDFRHTGVLTGVDPSYGGCKYS